jgi:hypothetical protein
MLSATNSSKLLLFKFKVFVSQICFSVWMAKQQEGEAGLNGKPYLMLFAPNFVLTCTPRPSIFHLSR